MEEEQTRIEEIRAIHEQYAWFYRVLRGAVLIGIGVLVGLLIYATPQAREAYLVNVFTSVLGLGATALIFDELNRKRSQDELKRQLVDDVASFSHDIAMNALHQLRRKGWLEGKNGLLRKANLQAAHLEAAFLKKANLQEADLHLAHLQKAILGSANLQEATLWNADLQMAYLGGANLEGSYLESANLALADLSGASLEEADLRAANLQGAQLLAANLKGANLEQANLRGASLGIDLLPAQFDEATILPDKSAWSPETDLRRFTHPEHPNFWQPGWLEAWEAADGLDDAD